LKLLISGDQVLPRISSNVSIHPTEPDADPMREWLESLAKLKREVPGRRAGAAIAQRVFSWACTRRLDYLGGCAGPYYGSAAQARCRSHAAPSTCSQPCSAEAIDQSDTGLLNLATGESLACLNYLWHRGEVRRWLDAPGVAWYQMV
jgi:hypothetical protein